MTPSARAAAVLSLAAACASCDDSSDQQSAATTTTAATTSATTTSSSTSTTGTAATTGTTASATTVSSTTVSSSSSSGTGGASSSTSSTTGMGGAAGESSDGVTGTTSGSAGGVGGSGGSGGTTAGVLVLEDECSHEACGGALPNTAWRHTRACVPKDQIIGPLQDFCPSITLVSSSGELEGAITFDETAYTQGVAFSLTIELDIPADCEINCSSFGATLAVLGFPGSTCEEASGSGSCRCVGTASGTDGRYGDYATTDDGTLTLIGLGDIEASYCVGDGTFSYLLPVNLVPQGTPMDVLYETVPQ